MAPQCDALPEWKPGGPRFAIVLSVAAMDAHQVTRCGIQKLRVIHGREQHPYRRVLGFHPGRHPEEGKARMDARVLYAAPSHFMCTVIGHR
jgi:hypothetical protein